MEERFIFRNLIFYCHKMTSKLTNFDERALPWSFSLRSSAKTLEKTKNSND